MKTRVRHRRFGDVLGAANTVVVTFLASLILLNPLAAADEKTTEPPVQAPPAEMRLLTQAQYLQTVAAIFGDDIVAKVRFAPVQRIDGLVAIGARTAALSLGALEPIDDSARSIAAQVVDPSHRLRLMPCEPSAADRRDDECARKFLTRVGRLLYRRSLTDAEAQDLVGTAGEAVGPAGDFYYGLAVALSRMLMSHNFLFVSERAEADPKHPGSWRLDAHSKASRLSFFLWNASPDSALLAAADSGELHDPHVMQRQVERLLKSPRLEQGVRAFFSDMLVFEGFDILAKDPIIYPAFTSKAVSEAREQLLRTIVDHLVTRNADYRDLFVTRHTFMTRDLAAVYRVPVDVTPGGWAPYEFPANDPRAGVLSLVGFLAKYSHPGRTSPTQRGRGLRETFLCQRVPDPPPNVDFSILEDPNRKMRTARERLGAHSTDAVCAGCHKLTDPIGLVFEHFDGAGQYRPDEAGVPLDTSGALDGVKVADAAGLGNAMRSNAALSNCFVSRLYSYGTGRKLDPANQELKRFLQTAFAESGYRVVDFLRLIATSDVFYAARPPAGMLSASNAQMIEK